MSPVDYIEQIIVETINGNKVLKFNSELRYRFNELQHFETLNQLTEDADDELSAIFDLDLICTELNSKLQQG